MRKKNTPNKDGVITQTLFRYCPTFSSLFSHPKFHNECSNKKDKKITERKTAYPHFFFFKMVFRSIKGGVNASAPSRTTNKFGRTKGRKKDENWLRWEKWLHINKGSMLLSNNLAIPSITSHNPSMSWWNLSPIQPGGSTQPFGSMIVGDHVHGYSRNTFNLLGIAPQTVPLHWVLEFHWYDFFEFCSF